MKKNILCKKGAALTLALVIAMGTSFSVLAGDVSEYSENIRIASESAAENEKEKSDEAINSKLFNFTSEREDGFVGVFTNQKGEAPVFSDEKGYGFVSETCAMPSRKVDISDIFSKDDGFYINEKDESRFVMVNGKGEEIEQSKCTTYDFGGMVFRVAVPRGAYKIEVETTGGADITSMSVSGMQTTRIETNKFWDAAKLVPVKNVAEWDGNVWSFNFVTGLPFIDIEIEPKVANKDVGVKYIKVTPIPVKEKGDENTTVFTLGDSTVKSYIFEEAPMCGWGQVFDRLFDLDKVNVINYSMGGRSMKSMYQEGRFNDILLNGKKGDYILIQSGHNDERKGTDPGTGDGENARFGGGSTEEMYKKYITDYYIPAVKSRGMVPILVTPMTRADGKPSPSHVYKNSFTTRKFPDVMRETAKEIGVTLVDLNSRSVDYLNEIGISGATAIVLSLEAGETPGKTNSGSYANGNPNLKVDGTHFKEALAKQYARMIVEEIYKAGENGDVDAKVFADEFLKADVIDAIKNNDWSVVYPEVCDDTVSGIGAYYRNQIEKMVQLGVMSKDKNGKFNPLDDMYAEEYINAISKLWNIDEKQIKGYKNMPLTREVMASVLYDAYNLKFKEKPVYMTNYNGTALSPDDPNYDPNLVGEEAQYYPLAGFGTLIDSDKISPRYAEKVKEAYNLGLIRSEWEIERGTMKNGVKLSPKQVVSRAKAAKSLYFAWVLSKPISDETDWLLDKEEIAE